MILILQWKFNHLSRIMLSASMDRMWPQSLSLYFLAHTVCLGVEQGWVVMLQDGPGQAMLGFIWDPITGMHFDVT